MGGDAAREDRAHDGHAEFVRAVQEVAEMDKAIEAAFEAWWEQTLIVPSGHFYATDNKVAAKQAWEAAFQAASGEARDSGVTVLPDGSAFFTATLPLPASHWLYAPQCEQWDSERDTSADTPHPILTNEHRHAVMAAMRWAIRGATMNGKEMDFDPDALALNAAYALCGPAIDAAIAAREV